MIRVVKPGAPAKITELAAITTGHCALHDADLAAYDSGEETFDILSANYGMPT
jgi:hypothetical protein